MLALHRRLTIFVLAFISLMLISETVHAHGYVHYPLARQQFCARDGGYWWPADGSAIPNAACRAAFLESGTFQFVQNIEFAANVADYNTIAAVKNVVKDNTLCAAGDNAKRGVNLAHAAWQRTVITPKADNSFDVLFYAATPHNPSFWEIYLSKPGYNAATQRLTWADLDRITQVGNIAIEKIDGRNMYRVPVKLPAGRIGDAVLFTRWQRQDPAGEGFYNCSDITIAGSNNETWYDKGVYIRSGTTVQLNDEVWFRVFNGTGQERVFEKLTITSANQSLSQWSAQIAAGVNSNYRAIVQIGVKNADGSIRFDSSNVAANHVWLGDSNDSFTLDIKSPQSNHPPVINLNALYQTNAGVALTINASASDPEGQTLTYAWQLPAGLSSSNTSTANLMLNAATPTQTTDYNISLRVSDGVNTSTANTVVRVIVGDGTNLPECNSRSTLSNGCKISNLAMNVVSGSNWINVWIPAGAKNLVLSSRGGSGNADMYVSSINWPTPSSYQLRSTNSGNTESVSISAANGGSWYYINLLAVTAYSGLSVQAVWQ